MINGVIDDDCSEYIIRMIIEYNYKKKSDHLSLIINSQGGNVTDGFAITDMMEASDIPVYTFGIGMVASAALFIFMSGDPGHRYLFKNTSVMSHQWAGVNEGKQHEIEAARKEDKLINKRILSHYERCTGLSKEDIIEKLLPASDVYLTPHEAKKFNLCDKIITKKINIF